MSSVPQQQRYDYTQDAMVAIRDLARSTRSDVHISFAPSPLDFSRSEHNVDWANYLQYDVVYEVSKI